MLKTLGDIVQNLVVRVAVVLLRKKVFEDRMSWKVFGPKYDEVEEEEEEENCMRSFLTFTPHK
jgi:hypothetical protein